MMLGRRREQTSASSEAFCRHDRLNAIVDERVQQISASMEHWSYGFVLRTIEITDYTRV
jgi:hypothetical protein